MIDPKNQKIFVKGKLVDFDKVPLHLQEKLLTSWKIKIDKNGTKDTAEEPTKDPGKNSGKSGKAKDTGKSSGKS